LAQKKKRTRFVIVFLFFIVYFFIAARPIPRETVLAPGWVVSLQNASEIQSDSGIFAAAQQFFPFTLGGYFGYADSSGQFALNRIKTNDIYLGQNMWTEYGAEPESLSINNINDNTVLTVENAGGYPILLDDRVFILGSEQNSLSEIDASGNKLWTYESGAPLTCIDVRAGLVLTGSLDGAVEVFNSSGERIFYFEPGGSRYSVILGCAMSRNGSRIAVICGIDNQRFLLFERLENTGGEYKIIYHEFLDTGFRRPVRVAFIDNDQRIAYERSGGIGFYNTRSRRAMFIPLEGEIAAIENSGAQGLLFLVTSHGLVELESSRRKNLVGIKFPPEGIFGYSRTAAQDAIFLRAPFKSDDVFLGRIRTSGSSSMLVTGGGTKLISFNLEER